jgi:hypothetical protein
MISNSKYLEYNSWLIKDVYNNETAKRSIDRIFNFPMMIKIDSNDMKNYIKREKLSYDWYYFPILIKEEQVGTNYYYKCNYCDSIRINKSRYAMIDCLFHFVNVGLHYTFIFVDHEKKEVEFYDPDVSTRIDPNLFMNKTLKHIFKGYKINEFWKLKKIQKTEKFEDDIYGFCVVWGHMMMHLKLLNINIPIDVIESSLIEETYDKKIALYELVLNYLYHMRRILPHNIDKFFKLMNLLK